MITIMCSGSRGDFQPYIALAQQLKKLGKDVKLAGFSEFEGLVRGYGIDYYTYNINYDSIGVDPEMIKRAKSSDNPMKMLLTFNKMKKYAKLTTSEMYKAMEGSELIVYHPGCTIGRFAAQEMGIPSVLASPFPMHKTNEYLSVVSYGKSKPTRINKKISYELLQHMLWLASGGSVKSFWNEHFGRLPEHFGCPYEKVSASNPAIISCSNFVFQRPKDWNVNINQFGYWFVEEIAEYTPPQTLAEFLENGEKPVYIGFGSMFNADQKDNIVKLIIDAMNKCGKRGIICGMGEIENLPKNLIAIGSIPHTWLFNKVSAVCHHGGAGTTAAGFRAGVPSIIIPFSNDQFAWGHRAYDLGVGSKPIYKKDLTADKLADAILSALKEKISENAIILANNINKENGANDCANVIARLIPSHYYKA